MGRWGLVVAAGAVLLAGCSSGSTPQAPSETPAAPPASSSSAPPPPPSPSVSSCPQGSYLLTGFEGRGAGAGAGKGSGGDIGVDFVDGTMTISSDGAQPTTVDLGAINAQLRLVGRISGTYTGDPGALQIAITGTEGEATIKGLGFTRTYSAADLAGQLIGTSATAQATCDDAAGTARLDLPNASLTLARR